MARVLAIEPLEGFNGHPMLNPTLALHLQDAFLTPPILAVGWVLAALGLVAAYRLGTPEPDDDSILAWMGLTGAGLFAAQLVTFPLIGGTSGHLMGGALATLLLGPWNAVQVMGLVVAVQALFGDGGLLAMGWNAVNLALVAPLAAHATLDLTGRWGLLTDPPPQPKPQHDGAPPTPPDSQGVATRIPSGRQAGAAAFVSVMCAALGTAAEVVASGTLPGRIGMPAIVGTHAALGLGEAALTAVAVVLIRSQRPDQLLRAWATPARGWATAGGLALGASSLVAAVLVSLSR